MLIAGMSAHPQFEPKVKCTALGPFFHKTAVVLIQPCKYSPYQATIKRHEYASEKITILNQIQPMIQCNVGI